MKIWRVARKASKRAEDRRSELRLAFHQIILVATEGGAGVVIDVVLDERDAVGRAQIVKRRLQQLIARDVVGHDVPQAAGTLARRIRCGPCRDKAGRR